MEKIGPKGFRWGIGRSERYLKELCSDIGSHYEKKVEEKEDGGKRIIQKPSDKLSAVQEKIQKTFLQKQEWPKWLFGAGDGRAQRENAGAHVGLNHHFVTDILKFYPSVNHRKVYDVFVSRLNFEPDTARIATRLTTYEGSLPQGTKTSPRLADLAFLSVDDSLVSFCEARGIVYTRYADDLTFSAGHSFKSEIPRIKSIVSDAKFRLHEGRKTSYKKGPIEVTGVIVTNNRLFAPPRLKDRLDQIDPGSDEWMGTFGYVQYIEPDFRRTDVAGVGPLIPK